MRYDLLCICVRFGVNVNVVLYVWLCSDCTIVLLLLFFTAAAAVVVVVSSIPLLVVVLLLLLLLLVSFCLLVHRALLHSTHNIMLLLFPCVHGISFAPRMGWIVCECVMN